MTRKFFLHVQTGIGDRLRMRCECLSNSPSGLKQGRHPHRKPQPVAFANWPLIRREFFVFVVIFAIVMPWLHPVEIWADDGTKNGARRTISTSRSSFAIDENGSLWAWGHNAVGQLGDDTTTERHVPVRVMDNVVTVTAAPRFTLAINTNSELWAWGEHALRPSIGATDTSDWRKPMQVMEGVHSIVVGLTHMMAIGLDGNLYAAGINYQGQLGDGTGTDSNRFIPIMEGVTAVSTGPNHTMAVKTDGTLWSWGANDDGQLGDGTTNDQHVPVHIMDDVLTVSTTTSHTMVIRRDGSLWGWGSNGGGQLGDGSTSDSRSPVHIMDDVIAVSVSGAHWGFGRTLAIKSDNSLWGWGDNFAGLLGTGLVRDVLEPAHIMDNIVFARSGDYHTSLAIDTEGNLWTWGRNDWGQLGDGSTEDKILPNMVKSNIMHPVPIGMLPAAFASNEAGEISSQVEGDSSQGGSQSAGGSSRTEADTSESGIGLLTIAVFAVIVFASILIALLAVLLSGRKKDKNHSGDFQNERRARDLPNTRYENRSNAPAYADMNQTELVAGMNAPISGRKQMMATELINSPRSTGNMNPYSSGNIQPIQSMSHAGPMNRQAPYDQMQANVRSSPLNGQAAYDPMQTKMHSYDGQMPHAAPRASGEFDPSVIAASYSIEREVGGGAMSRTFVVRSKKLDNLWFLKFVSNQYGQLASEEKILKLLNHVCLPKIIDVFHKPEGVYLIQTLVEGIPLDKFREIKMKLSEDVLLGWFEQIAKTLNYLQDIRPTPVFHLDLKPGNIIVTHDNMLVLVDFGISRRFGEDSSGAFAVTAAYAAPEQFGGFIPAKYAQSVGERFGVLPPDAVNWRIDARTDVYSLGVIMFELATNQGPTQRNITSIKNYVSNEFSYVIVKCMAVNPAARYNSVMEVLEDVRRIKAIR